MKMSVHRFCLMSFLGMVALFVVVVGTAMRPRYHATDHLTLVSGQTTAVRLKCPAESFQWDGSFRLADGVASLPLEPSQIVMRMKNEGSAPLGLSPLLAGDLFKSPEIRSFKFAAGETKEIYRGTVEDFLKGGGRLQMFSEDRKDAQVELQIDATFAQTEPLKMEVRWFYTRYGF